MDNVMYEVNIKLIGNEHARNTTWERILEIIEHHNQEPIASMNEEGNLVILTPVDINLRKVNSDYDEDN